MKILVLSDSHRRMRNVYRVLDKIENKTDCIIHLGDMLEDCEKIKTMYPKMKVYNVSGNCDFGSLEESTMVFDTYGKRFFITHGHKYGVKSSLARLAYAGAEKGADICLFGHTHMPVIENYNGIVIMNPGSISEPRGSSVCSYGVIDIDDNGIITASVVGIFDDVFKVIL